MSIQKRNDSGLFLLADFMNTAVWGATKKQWQKLAGKFNLGYQLNLMSLGEAIELRCELHDALSFLRLDARRLRKIDNPYDSLVVCLNGLKMPTNYQCTEIKKGGALRPGQAILRSRDKRRWVAQFWPNAPGPKELLYTLLAGALIDGTMNRLKVCRHCGRYFAARDIKREFCPGEKCRIKFFNRLMIESRRERNRALRASKGYIG